MSSWYKKPHKEWCAVRIIPFKIDSKGEINLIMGLDTKWKEWTPFGGACTGKDKASPCYRKTTSELRQCLSRELTEESKQLIDLYKTVDFVNCKYIHYIINLHWGSIHNNIYLAEWTGDDRLNEVMKKFRDPSYDKNLRYSLSKSGEDEKAFFEMSDIGSIKLNYDVFGEYLYNTIQDIHKNISSFRKDREFYKQLEYVMGGLLDNYKYKQMENTDGKRFDPRFIVGLIQSTENYLMMRDSFKKIEKVIDGIDSYIRKNRGCTIDFSNL